jgi:hypothetical protein
MVLDRFIDHPLTDVARSMVTALVEPDLRWGTRAGFALDAFAADAVGDHATGPVRTWRKA